MSKKTLLKEATIRRFMKLASIDPLAENFVDKFKKDEEELEEGGMGPYDRDDEMAPEEEPLPGEELPGEELPGEELPGEELPGEELPGEEGTGLDLTPEQAEEVAEKLAQGFAGVVEDALGVEGLLSVSTEGEGEVPMEEPPMEEPPMDAPEPPMEEPPEEEDLAGEPLEEKEESDEDPLEETEEMDDETIDKITEKVTAALHEKLQKKKQQKNKDNKKKQYIDNLAERVVSRIFSSTKDK